MYYRCHDAKETVQFYTQHPIWISFSHIRGSCAVYKEPGIPYMHVFLMRLRNVPAFSSFPMLQNGKGPANTRLGAMARLSA